MWKKSTVISVIYEVSFETSVGVVTEPRETLYLFLPCTSMVCLHWKLSFHSQCVSE
jgi:hypothetical protein